MTYTINAALRVNGTGSQKLTIEYEYTISKTIDLTYDLQMIGFIWQNPKQSGKPL